jgi:hypothetical protein
MLDSTQTARREDRSNVAEDELLTRLRTALEPYEILGTLRAMGLDPKDLAMGVGADERTVRRWLDGQEPNRSHEDGLANVRVVVLYLLQRRALTLRQLPRWLRMPNIELDFAAPLEMIARGRRADVIAAADEFIAPRPPSSRRYEAQSHEERSGADQSEPAEVASETFS